MQAEVNIKASFKAAQDKNLVKDAQAQGKKAGQAFGKQAGKGISDALKKNKDTFNSLKDLVTGKGLNIASFAKLLTNPITAILGGITLAVGLYDKIKSNINKINQENFSENIQDIKERMQNREKEYAQQDQSLKTLREMAKIENLSNAERAKAIALIKQLNGEYKGLKLTLNTLTGQIQVPDNAGESMERQRLKKEQADLQEAIANSKQLQWEQVDSISHLIQGNARNENILQAGQIGLNVNQNINNSGFRRGIANLTDAAIRIPGAHLVYNGLTGKNATDNILYGKNTYIGNGTEKGAFADLSTQEQLKRIKMLRQTGGFSVLWGSQGERQKVADIQKNLKDRLQMEKKLQENLQKQLNLKIKYNAQEQALARATKTVEKGKQQGYQKSLESMKRNQQYNALTSNEDRIAFLKKQQSDLANERKLYEMTNAGISKKTYADSDRYRQDKIKENDMKRQMQELMDKGEANLSDAEKKRLAELKRGLLEIQLKLYTFDKQRRQDQVQMAKNETQIKRIMLEQAKIQERINALKKIEKDYVDSTLKGLDTSVMKYELQGDYQKATQEQIRRNAQAKGIKNLDPENLKKLMDATDTFRKYTLQQAMKGNFQSTYDNLTAGKRTAYEEYQYQKRQYEERFKTQLTGKQETALLDKINAEFGMKDNQKYLEYLKKGMGQIKTNELTARGGFAGGAYIPQTADYAKQIATYNQQQNSYLQQIKQAVISLGTIN